MNGFKNMKIGKKLITGFVLVAFLTGIVGTVGVLEISNVDRKYGDLYEEYGVSLGYLTEIGTSYHIRRGALKDLLIQTNVADEQATAARIKELDTVINDNMKLYEQTLPSEESRKKFEEFRTLMAKYDPVKEQIARFALAHQDAESLALMTGEGNMMAANLDKAIEEMTLQNVTTGRALAADYSHTTAYTIVVISITVAVAVILAVALGLYISRLISKPLTAMVSVADQIADGDLDVTIDVDSRDEVGRLAGSFRTMSDRLNQVMASIISASEQVASGSRQVSESSVTLSQGATEQASSVEQLTTSLEEISSQTKQNARNANEASSLAETAKANAVQGNEQMKHMLEAMEEINNASGNISKIIKVIDEIAFQTNILALNAAVEAARAGQHGKGFAVVAEEVRNLAARSANAAKETTDMIEGSINKVMAGTKIANETAEALNHIVEGVAKVAALVNDIALASNEQAVGISQINQGISQVAEVTQTNSATSEESAAASEELTSQAQLLKDQVSRFKLKKSGMQFNNRGLEEVNPDVLRLLDEMNGRNKGGYAGDFKGAGKEAAAGNHRIVLSDREFGKY